MNRSGERGNYRPPQRHRRRRDGSRIIMMGAVAVLFVAVVVFAVLVGIELWGGEGDPVETPDNETVIPASKFETAEIWIPSEDVHSGDLLLINRDHPYVFPKTAPNMEPIVNGRESHGNSASGNPIYSYYTQNGINRCAKMESATLEKFQEWTDAFYEATGNSDLFVLDADGYRDLSDQDNGTTEHHTGKVIDLYVWTGTGSRSNLDDAANASTFKWIYDNAYKYGFIHRYPAEKAGVTGKDNEPYHFRYVGYPHAYYMYKNGLCLEEYLDKVKEYTPEQPLEFKADDGYKYMVYYFPADADETTALKVPAEYTYTVSGDNREGFVVMVKVDK